MNIIKTLEGQQAAGNTIILESGAIVADAKVRQEVLKEYLAGVKEGKIPLDKSFNDYYSKAKKKFLTVSDVLAYIKDEGEDEPEEQAEPDTEQQAASETVQEPEQQTAPEEQEEPEEQAPPAPEKKPVTAKRRTRK